MGSSLGRLDRGEEANTVMMKVCVQQDAGALWVCCDRENCFAFRQVRFRKYGLK